MDILIEYVKTFWILISSIFYSLEQNVRWIFRNFKRGMSNNLTCLNGKTAIITGGNSGIGYTTSMLLASRGCRVIIACRRDAVKERDVIIQQTNNPNITVKHLDLSSLASVRSFAENIKNEETKIDILINNAGIGYSQNMLSEDGLDMVMQSNYFGHFLLTHLLIDLLKAANGARVVFLTSALAIEHNLSRKMLYPAKEFTAEGRTRSYSNSKACSILVAQEMNKKLAKYGIKVNCADPGVVRTPIFDTLKGVEKEKVVMRIFLKFTTFVFSADVRRAGETILHLVASEDIEGGLNYFRCEPFLKPRRLDDKHFCEEIWKETEKIVNLCPGEKL